jgi:hypothetical protein
MNTRNKGKTSGPNNTRGKRSLAASKAKASAVGRSGAPKAQVQTKTVRTETKNKKVQIRKVDTKPKINRTMNRTLVKSRIPEGRATQSLRFHGNKNASGIDRRLKTQSPWYQSIIDPLHGADAKIPDDCGDETGTLQLVQRGLIEVPALANACTGVVTQTLFPSAIGPNEGYTATNPATSTNVLVDFLVGTRYDTTDALQAYAQGVRVVSAAIYVQPECTLANAAGEICMFVVPGEQKPAAPETYDEYVNKYGSVTIPLNTQSSSMARWYPIKMNRYANAQENTDYSAFYDPFNAAPDPHFMGFITNGVPAGVSLRWTIVINYEFLPQENSINILNAKPSPADSTEVDLVENWVQSDSPVRPVSLKMMETPPSPVSPTHDEAAENDESGFGMFFNVLKELAPLALEGAAMLL